MISYLYWITLIAVALLVGGALSRFLTVKAGIVIGLVILLVGWAAYYFYYEQLFVKNLGGVMTLEVPAGQMHLSATWKEDHLWIENYDPVKNICYFSEVSRGHLLEGTVIIKNCNPGISPVQLNPK